MSKSNAQAEISPAEPDQRAAVAAAELAGRTPSPEAPQTAGSAVASPAAPVVPSAPRDPEADRQDLESLIRPAYLIPVVLFAKHLDEGEIEEALKEADEAAVRAGRRMGSRIWPIMGSALPIGAFIADPIVGAVRLWVKWRKRRGERETAAKHDAKARTDAGDTTKPSEVLR